MTTQEGRDLAENRKRLMDADYTSREVRELMGKREGPVYVRRLRNGVQHLASESDHLRKEFLALNEVCVEKHAAALAAVERVEGKVDTLKDREELVAVTRKADELYERLNHEGQAKERAIEQARSWKQEAKTQQGIVRDMCEAVGIPAPKAGFEVAEFRDATRWVTEVVVVDIETYRQAYRWDLTPSDSRRCQDCKHRVFAGQRKGPLCSVLDMMIADTRKSVCSGWASVTGEEVADADRPDAQAG